jgi:pheromone shutdown-related protein TraB
MDFENLNIIGTSHIAEQSIKEIEKQFRKIEPDIIAVELDKGRMHHLMDPNPKKRRVSYTAIKKVGLKGFIFALIGSWVSQKLGKMVGVEPGSDMKRAIELAKEGKKNLALIDQDIEITLRKFSTRITGKEKRRFVADIFNGIFFKKRQMKKYGLHKIDLSKVPEEELIEKMMEGIKERYPSIHLTLISERNEIMARRLVKIMKENPDKKIVAVVGAGHKREMLRIIKERWNMIEVV